jgi:hypothetical protein
VHQPVSMYYRRPYNDHVYWLELIIRTSSCLICVSVSSFGKSVGKGRDSLLVLLQQTTSMCSSHQVCVLCSESSDRTVPLCIVGVFQAM